MTFAKDNFTTLELIMNWSDELAIYLFHKVALFKTNTGIKYYF